MRQIGGTNFHLKQQSQWKQSWKIKCLKKKKIRYWTTDSQCSQTSFPLGTLNRGEGQSPPFFHQTCSINLPQNAQCCCQVLLWFLPFFFSLLQITSTFSHPIIPSSPLTKKIRATQELKMDDSLFSLDRIEAQTTYKNLAKRIFFTAENSSRGKKWNMKNPTTEKHGWHANAFCHWFYKYSVAHQFAINIAE